MEIWHNPRCSKSRSTLGLLEEAGVEPTVRRYLDDPPDRAMLVRALELLDRQPWELVRTGEDVYRDLGMGEWPRDASARDRWLDAMLANPRLIERPVVIDGERAVVGRPPERVRELL